MSNNKKVVVQFPICMVLFIVFLVLKLTNTIDWSWWWVTAPLWLPIGLALIILCVFIVILGILALPQVNDLIKGKW